MTDDDYSFDGCRTKLRDATRIVLDKEGDYVRAVERSADAEAVYRSELAAKLKGHREAGKAVEESLALARADVAVLSRERDYAAGMVKVAAEQVSNARDSRRSLWRLVEWARARDVATFGAQRQGDQQQLGVS